MFAIEMLPAHHGDALLIEYGDAESPRFVLIDGGTTATWKCLGARLREIKKRRNGKLHLELFVVTHIDADHIGGSLRLLEQLRPLGITIGEIWFNGYPHLDNKRVAPTDRLGARQGEQLSLLIQDARIPWNARFDYRAVVVPSAGALPQLDIVGLQLTLLSPTLDTLKALKRDWHKELLKAGLIPGEAYKAVKGKTDRNLLGDTLGSPNIESMARHPFVGDHSTANGSSIAFLAKYEKKTALFAADAFADVLLGTLRRGPLTNTPVLKLDALKLSHHGSKGNTSIDFVQALPSRHYLISSNGAQFEHPDRETIARIAVHGPKDKHLHFNYKTSFNRAWGKTERMTKWKYHAHFGTDDAGLRLEL